MVTVALHHRRYHRLCFSASLHRHGACMCACAWPSAGGLRSSAAPPGIDDRSLFLPLETCAQSAGAASPARVAVFELPAAATASDGAAAFVAWGSARAFDEGGRYRLCWCARPAPPGPGNTTAAAACSAAEDFLVDAGELTVVGPTPAQDLSGAPRGMQASAVHGQACGRATIGPALDLADG